MQRKVLSGYVKAYIASSFSQLLDLRPEQLKLVSREDIGDIVNNVELVVRVRTTRTPYFNTIKHVLLLY